MTLYLQVSIGSAQYLLDASRVLEIREGIGDGHVRWQGVAASIVDLPALFDEAPSSPASVILTEQQNGNPAALIVDRVDGLAEFDAAEFRPLPSIGPIGGMIDAIALRPADQRPLLRLCGERALAIATVVG